MKIQLVAKRRLTHDGRTLAPGDTFSIGSSLMAKILVKRGDAARVSATQIPVPPHVPSAPPPVPEPPAPVPPPPVEEPPVQVPEAPVEAPPDQVPEPPVLEAREFIEYHLNPAATEELLTASDQGDRVRQDVEQALSSPARDEEPLEIPKRRRRRKVEEEGSPS